MANVVVVGAGVSGLTCAVLLREAGHAVRIVARDEPLETTSAVAAALWYPLREFVDRRSRPLAMDSYGTFLDLAARGVPGIVVRDGIEVWRGDEDEAWWRENIPRSRAARADELPPGYRGMLLEQIPVIEMSLYLPWLAERAGAPVERRSLDSLEGIDADVVVNCAGLGAATLAGDASLEPIRGQVVRVENPGLDRFLLDERGPHQLTYVVPRSRDVVLGGTRGYGETSLDPDPAVAAAIVERAVALEPRLAGARVVSHAVGLRPGRPSLRLEREGDVVHDYGHGGSGVTLSWGCAREVVRLVPA